MEEDILKGFEFEINNIINHCLNSREITAIEYMFIKQTLLLKIEDLIKKNERLINKYKEQEKIIKLMAKDIAENKLDEDICRQVKDPKKEECYAYIYDDNACSDCVIEYYEKKARDENGNRNNN